MREGAGEEAAEKVEIFDGVRAVLKLDQVILLNIIMCIKYIYEDDELKEEATVRNFRIVQTEGTR